MIKRNKIIQEAFVEIKQDFLRSVSTLSSVSSGDAVGDDSMSISGSFSLETSHFSRSVSTLSSVSLVSISGSSGSSDF